MRPVPISIVMETEWHRHSPRTPWTYRDLDLRQREIARAGGRVLLVSEVAPVLTLGRRSDPSDLLWPEAQYARQGIEILRTDRGGRTTYHGPGQWIFFPVAPMSEWGAGERDVKRVVERLLGAVLRVIQLYFSEVYLREGEHLGIWSGRGKLASVGVEVRDGYLFHGISVNGYATAQSFWGIRPCGLNAQTDSVLANEDPAAFEALGARLADSILTERVSGVPAEQ